MDAKTARAYERDADRWVAARTPNRRTLGRLQRLARTLPQGARVADLGCGPGWYAAVLEKHGLRPVALDVSAGMLAAARREAPDRDAVRADLGSLPFSRHALDAAVAYNSYQHLPIARLPIALAHLHAALRVGAPVDFTLGELSTRDPTPEQRRRGAVELRWHEDEFPGRLFSFYGAQRVRRLLTGAGFTDIRIDRGRDRAFWLWVRATRAHTLPDYVRPGLDLLVCGLNPSLLAAETGVPYGRPGNRFWPAALKARVCTRDRDPWNAVESGVGFTDLVKRPTRGASDLSTEEYRTGLERLDDCVRFFEPRAICFVGLDGWRRTVDRQATAGWVPGGFAGRPAYLMPSTSGLNAHCDLGGFVRHLRRASRGAPARSPA